MLPDLPLLAQVGGQPLALAETELEGAALTFVAESGDRMVLLAGPVGRRKLAMKAWPDHLEGAQMPPELVGTLPGLPDPPAIRGLRLEVSKMSGGKVEGRIVMCLEAPDGSLIAGAFEARVPEHRSDTPDVTRDHDSVMKYLAEKQLGASREERSRYRHRGTWIDADAGVGYDHVVFERDGKRTAQTMTFRRDGKTWKLDRTFAGDQIPEAHAPENATEPTAVLERMVAVRVESALRGASSVTTFWSELETSVDDAIGEVLVTIRPDMPRGEDAKPITYKVHTQRQADGTWSLADVEASANAPPLLD